MTFAPPPLPEPCHRHFLPELDLFSREKVQEYARQYLQAFLAAGVTQVLWQYGDTESVIRTMDGYTPGENWAPVYRITEKPE